MNKVFRKIHLWLSVPVGLIITVICLTGAALVFERDVTESLDPELYKVTYTEGNAPLPPSELVAAIRRQVPDSLELLSLQLPGEIQGYGKAFAEREPLYRRGERVDQELPFFPDHAQTAPVADGPACL